MQSRPLIPAVFVASRSALAPSTGGVQHYTRELLETLRHAGFDLQIVDYVTDMRPVTRLRRKLRPRPYTDRLRPDLPDDIIERQRKTGSRFIFLSGVELAPVAEALRARIDKSSPAQLVLFSYGLDSVDYLQEARAAGQGGNSSAALLLGRQLFAECYQRQFLDHVFCLAPFEAEIERWLGARRVHWIPRTVPAGQALDWRPDASRVGCVSTVDHPPNREGLLLLLEQLEPLAPAGMRFRLVGGPVPQGRALAERFQCVDFLGPLDDAALRAEAVTWSCFVHPMFCYARGCSTKLAVALAWRLPVATTPAGARGYLWSRGSLPFAETPRALAELTVSMLDPQTAEAARREIDTVAASCPTFHDVAADLRAALLSDAIPMPPVPL